MAKEQLDLEQEVKFKIASDRKVLAVQTEDTHESLFEISGYDLRVIINKNRIQGIQDVENLLEGIQELYRKMILKELLGNPENS